MGSKEVEEMVEVRKRLDALIGIMLTPNIQNSTNQNKITYLASLDFTNTEIANMLNTSPNVVAKEKSVRKRKGGNE